MLRLILLAWLTTVAPAMAQNQPVRVVNSNAVTATGLFMRAVGQEEWGDNLLGRLLLPPGAFFSVQLGDGGGCRFDVRLVLRDGRSAMRRNMDLCNQRVVQLEVGGQAPAPQPETTPE